MKTRLRIGFIALTSIFALAAVFLFGPSLIHSAMRASTGSSALLHRQSEWALIVQTGPQALNGPNRDLFQRYSAHTFRWFRVRGMIDPTCEDTSPVHEWRELFAYVASSPHVAPPPELSITR